MRTFVVSILFVVSGVLGFLCQMLYANYFGSGKEMDIYFSLLSIPAIITGATGTIFSSLFFPIFARKKQPGLDDYIYTIKVFVSRIALFISIIGFSITYLNLSRIIETNTSLYYKLAIILSVLFWLNGYFSIVNGYLASVQNYFKNFLVVSSTQLLVYVFIIIFVVFFHNALGVKSIAVGMVCASVVSLIINRFYGNVFHKGKTLNKIFPLKLLSNTCLIIISFLPFHAFASISYLWAGQLEFIGGVSLLGYSHSFCGLLSTAASMGIATVSFPNLARSLSSSDSFKLHEGFLNYRSQLEVVVIFASYVAVFVSIFAHPIIEILFMRGQFDLKAVNGLSSVLPIYLVDGIFIAMMNLTRNVYYSLNKQKLFAFISGLVTFVFLLSSILLSRKVNYLVIGMFEAISMGLFLMISLYYIHLYSKIFNLKYTLQLVGQIFLLVADGWLMIIVYEEMRSFGFTILFSIIICGIIYSLLADFLLSTLIKNPIVLALNRIILRSLR